MDKNNGQEVMDKELVVIQKEAGDIITRAHNFQINSPQTFEDATKVRSVIFGWLKQIEEKRLFFKKPLTDQGNKIDEMFKSYSQPCKDADIIIVTKMELWREKIRKEQEAETERVQIEAGKLSKKTDIPVEEIIKSTEVKEIQTKFDNATIKKVWDYELIDMTKIPRLYLKANDVKIGFDVRQKGIREIPGIRIFEKEIFARR